MVEFLGGEVGDLDNLKSSLAESSGDGTWIRTIPADGELKVRFLTEPDKWRQYYEHWCNSPKGYYACTGSDAGCYGCTQAEIDEEKRRSKRFLVNALDVENGRVIPLKLPVDLVNRLVTRYERYETMIDRDYILTRTGKGLQTIYDLDPCDKDALDVGRYSKDLFNLGDKLKEQWDEVWGEGAKKAKADKPKVSSSVPVDEDSDEDTDEPVALTLDDLKAMKAIQLMEVAEDQGVQVDEDWNKQQIIDAIVAAAS